jgi:uncharacterized protein YdcH (DUF465 family)
MPLTHHLLAKKFPEYKEKIHNLKASNNPFNRLLKRYETIEKKLYCIESGEQPSSDGYVNALGKERLQLKDERH